MLVWNLICGLAEKRNGDILSWQVAHVSGSKFIIRRNK